MTQDMTHQTTASTMDATMDATVGTSDAHQADPARRARLRWRARRGLLENDLVLTRFLDGNEDALSDEEVGALTALLDLSDNELMDLILARTEPVDALDRPDIVRLVGRLREV